MVNDAVTAVRNAVDAINDRSIGDRGAELLDPSVVRPDLAELFRDSHGPAGASDSVSMIISAMPGFRLAIEDIFGTGDRAVARLRMSGTHTAPGRSCPASPHAAARCQPARCSSTGSLTAASPKPGSSCTAWPSTARRLID